MAYELVNLFVGVEVHHVLVYVTLLVSDKVHSFQLVDALHSVARVHDVAGLASDLGEIDLIVSILLALNFGSPLELFLDHAR